MSLLKRELTPFEVERLERLAGSRVAQARLVERARIVLVASRTKHMCDAVRSLGKDKDTIRMWAERFSDEGFDGLQDRHRCGRTCTYSPEDYAQVIQAALTNPKDLGLEFGSWTLDRLTLYLHEQGNPMSRTRIAQILRGEGLRWHLEESWPRKTEGVDPEFREKRGRLSGLTASLQKVH